MWRVDRGVNIRYRSSRETSTSMDDIGRFLRNGKHKRYQSSIQHIDILQFIRWTAVEAIGLSVELGLWMVSIHFIWSLQMALAKKLTITAIFAVRLGYAENIAKWLHAAN